MGSSTTPTILRALLVPDPRFRVDAFAESLSTLTQEGPLPGVPEAQDETEMVLEAVGEQSSTSQLRIKTVRGGHAGTNAARFVWKYEGDSSSEYRGWDPPVCPTGFEFIDASSTSNKWKRFHTIALQNGTIAVACGKDTRQTVVWTRNPDTGVWTETEVYDPGSALSATEPYPTLVEMPSGRLLCFFWAESGSKAQLYNYYSDDGGTTWTQAQKGCLADAIDTTVYTPKKIRAAYLNGQICLIVALRYLTPAPDEEHLRQYASNDLGASFTLVSTLDDIDRGFPAIIAHKGKLVVTYVSEDATSGSSYPPKFRLLGSAYEPFESASGGVCQDDADPMEWASQSGGVFDSGDMTLWADEDDVLWVMGRDHASGTFELSVRASFDDGATWHEVGGGPAAHQGTSTWRGEDTATYPIDMSACAHRGRAFVAHRFNANPGTLDDSFAGMWLGGYTSVCLAQESGKGTTSPKTVTGWTVTWLPYDDPQNVGNWTATSTGTSSLGSIGLRFVTGVAQTEYRMYNNIVGSLSEGVTVLAECRTWTNQCRVEVRWNDSVANEYEVAAIVTTTRIRLWDLVAGSEIAGVDTTDGYTGYVQLLLDCQSNNAVLYYRSLRMGGSSPVGASGDRLWTKVGETSSCSNAGAISAAGHRVRFGQTDSSESYWRMCHFMSDEYTGVHIYGQDNYGDLLGRSFMPTPVYVDGGTKIQAVDGPTFRNDDWHIDPRYTFPVTNIFPDVAASPRRTWRSTTDANDVEIAWRLDNMLLTRTLGPLVGLYLGGCNFPIADLYGMNAANAWVKLADLDLRCGTSLKWTRDGRVVTADLTTSGSVPFHLHTDQLAGSHIRLALADGEQESETVRKITTNSEGVWKAGSTSLPTRILLESVEVTDPSSGTTAELWSKDYCAVLPVTAAYKAFKLVIPGHTTCEGYFEIGNLVFGQVFPVGGYLMGYGWGRKLDWAYAWEQVEGRTGIRTVQSLGPTRRAVEVGWTDGVDSSTLSETTPSYVVAWKVGSPEPVCVPAALPYSVGGLLSQVQGATLPVVYLAACPVPGTSSDVEHNTNRNAMLYGRVVSETVQSDVVVGDEEKNELLRVNTMRLEEEV